MAKKSVEESKAKRAKIAEVVLRSIIGPVCTDFRRWLRMLLLLLNFLNGS
jgi:hypothetical protein